MPVDARAFYVVYQGCFGLESCSDEAGNRGADTAMSTQIESDSRRQNFLQIITRDIQKKEVITRDKKR